MQEANTAAQKSVDASPIRIAVERWGIPEQEMGHMLRALNACDTRLVWEVNRPGMPADIVIHMVDLARLAGPTQAAAWNLMGPVEALRAARATGTPAIALVKGAAHQLPMLRTGCWAMSGTRDLVSAARILAGAVIVGAQEDDHIRRQRLVELASLNATAVLHRVVTTSEQTLAATLDTLLGAAAGKSYAVPSHAYVGVSAGTPLTNQYPWTVRALDSQREDGEADLLLAYPWPDLYDAC